MFEQLKVPLLGVVENMSYFTGDDGKRYELFGSGGGAACAAEWQIPLLAHLPIFPQAAIQGDAGDPITHSHPDSEMANLFLTLATQVQQRCHVLARQATELPALS